MPGWVGNQADAPEPGALAKQEDPELNVISMTPRDMPNSEQWGWAYCAHCEEVVSHEQALVRGPLIDTEGDPRYDGRPIIAHQCKQARGTIHLYCDNGVSHASL